MLMRCIGRNIILYTLILDDTNASNHMAIWDIYYHFLIDDKSIELVRLQAKKLHDLATSMEAWHSSKYGQVFRFCDELSLKKVQAIWDQVSTSDLTDGQLDLYNAEMKAHIPDSIYRVGNDDEEELLMKLQAIRSIAPFSDQHTDVRVDHYHQYWKSGTTYSDPTNVAAARHFNPMFACLVDEKLKMRHSANPFLGFHLATAHVPLSKASPLRPRPPTRASLSSGAEDAARVQFKAWSTAFRNCADKNITLRFFVGDPIAFCNTLGAGALVSANLYREAFSFEPLVIDSEDYSPSGSAPRSFNVIDTSTLTDHVGAINVLTAASPLLNKTISSTLYTETMASQTEITMKEFIRDTLSGEVAGIAVMFGLFPPQYYSNASATSTAEEGLSEPLTGTVHLPKRIVHSKLIWKRPPSSIKIRFQDMPLYHFLHGVYGCMFHDETMRKIGSRQTYNRGSFAAMLLVAKSNVEANWVLVIHCLLGLILRDEKNGLLCRESQELVVQLHILGLVTIPPLANFVTANTASAAPEALNAMADIPPVVCITLKVPRSYLRPFTRPSSKEILVTQVHCILKTDAMPYGNSFAILQMSFGTISTSGARNSSDFKVHVSEDKSGWAGDSDLIMSFYVPTHLIILHLITGTVYFATTSAPGTCDLAIGRGGLIFGTTLGNPDNLYITAHPPGQSNYPVPVTPVTSHLGLDRFADISISAELDSAAIHIKSFTGHINITDEAEKRIFQRGCSICQTSPFSFKVALTNTAYSHMLIFPAPVLCKKIGVVTEPQSSHIAVVVPIHRFWKGKGIPGFMFPCLLQDNRPVLMNMPCIDLQQLPILDVTNKSIRDWFRTHMYFQFSKRDEVKGWAKNSRIGFKKTVFSLFLEFCDHSLMKGKQIFGLCSEFDERPHFLIYPSAIRIDGSNRTVVLDAAVLLLTDKFVKENRDVVNEVLKLDVRKFRVKDAELALWIKTLPAFVERCRDWKHTDSCEYVVNNSIPLGLAKGISPLCSCGNGKTPDKFITRTPKWNKVSKDAVRVAIPCCFPAPHIEKLLSRPYIEKHGKSLLSACHWCNSLKPMDWNTMLVCKCEKVNYCSRKCRIASWPEHKPNCYPVPK